MRKALFFLGILNDADVEWMIAAGVKQQLNPGEVLIQEGKAATSVFLVLEGVLSVVARAAGNQEVARLRSGEIVGEMSFVDSRPPSATVRAIEASSVLAIPRRGLEARLSAGRTFRRAFLPRHGRVSFRPPSLHGGPAGLRLRADAGGRGELCR